MRRTRSFFRAVLIVVIGLAAAFGVFRAFGWPSSLQASSGDEIAFGTVEPGQLLHAGLGPFTVVGTKPVSIESVRFAGSLSGIEIVSVRVSPLAQTVQTLKGESPQIAGLPTASGYSLKPGERGFFVVSFRVTQPGAAGFDGIRIGYRSGWLSRATTIGPSVNAVIPAGSPAPTPTG